MNHRNVLVKLGRFGDLISISTISRMCGYKGRFLIWVSHLDHWLQSPISPYLDTDCGHYLRMWKVGNRFDVRITWLNTSESGKTSGFNQDFSISADDLKQLVYGPDEQSFRRLHQPMPRQSKIIFDGRCKAPDNKLVRRAFSKAMRDHFLYGSDEQILLYPDYAHGYGFVNYFGEKAIMSGGLIAHFTNMQAPNGRTYPKVTYSVHT